MRGLFAARIGPMGGEGVIEGLAVNILSVRREVVPDRKGKIVITEIGHVRRSKAPPYLQGRPAGRAVGPQMRCC